MGEGEPSAWGEVTGWADSGGTPVGGVPVGGTPIVVGGAEPTQEQQAYWDGQARLGEHIEANRQHLSRFVEHAHEVGHVLYASWPNLDAPGVDALTAELHQIAADAGNACAGLPDWSAAHQGFQAVGYWSQHAAGISGGLMERGEQEQHAALSDLLNSLGSMHASLVDL